MERPRPGIFRSAAENEADDRELLRVGAPAVRTAVLTDRSLSIGVGVREGDPMVVRARGVGMTVLRRSSGGTGVVHAPGDVAWAVVLPRDDRRRGPDLSAAYDRLGRGAADVYRTRGFEAAWLPSPGRSERCCLLGYRGRALSVGGRVVGGAAQHLTGRALLHHGVLPFEVDRAAHGTLFGLEPGDVELLAGTNDFGFGIPSEELALELRKRILGSLGIPDDRHDGDGR